MWFPRLFIVTLVYLSHNGDSAKILAVLPIPAYSHQIIYRTVLLGLHSRGHNIVVMTPNPMKDKAPKENYTEVDLSFLHKHVNKTRYVNVESRYRIEILYSLMSGMEVLAHDVFSLQEVNEIMTNKEHFDVVLVEWCAHPSFYAFSELFNVPLIGIRSLGLRIEGQDAIANPVVPSFIPVAYMDYNNDFWGRVTNFITLFSVRFLYKCFIIPRAEDIVQKYFANHTVHVSELEKSVSIILTNTHPILTGPRPLVPANIEIGGVHLQQNLEQLPKDIEKYLDDAKEGAILFSLGTFVSSSELSKNQLKIFTEAFSELPYKIIWKWDIESFENKPNNVQLYNWIPQPEVLAHPNLRLFITHGGLQSTEEAISYHVPMIGIPFFADQHLNVRRIEQLGIGKHIQFSKLTKRILVDTITEIMRNSSYHLRCKEVANILMDNPESPLDKAIWWIEYVIRHKGATHLKTDAVEMSWYIYYSFDVIAFLTIAICVFMYIIIVIRKVLIILWSIVSKKKIRVKLD